jgi:hypothetical protein
VKRTVHREQFGIGLLERIELSILEVFAVAARKCWPS